MKNWKPALVLLSLTLVVSANAKADDRPKLSHGESCLQSYYQSRDAVALKDHVKKGDLLSDTQVAEIKIPAGCTQGDITNEMEIKAAAAIEAAIGDSKPLGVPDSLWTPGSAPSQSDNSAKPYSYPGPMGEENLLKALSALAF